MKCNGIDILIKKNLCRRSGDRHKESVDTSYTEKNHMKPDKNAYYLYACFAFSISSFGSAQGMETINNTLTFLNKLPAKIFLILNHQRHQINQDLTRQSILVNTCLSMQINNGNRLLQERLSQCDLMLTRRIGQLKEVADEALENAIHQATVSGVAAGCILIGSSGMIRNINYDTVPQQSSRAFLFSTVLTGAGSACLLKQYWNMKARQVQRATARNSVAAQSSVNAVATPHQSAINQMFMNLFKQAYFHSQQNRSGQLPSSSSSSSSNATLLGNTVTVT